MTVALTGLGTAQPRTIVPQKTLARAALDCCCTTERERRLLIALYDRAGVVQRGVAILDLDDEPPATIQQRFPPATHPHDRGPRLEQRMHWYRRSANTLARRAAQHALQHASTDPARIAHLVTVSCTGFAAPGTDCHLIDTLPLNPRTTRTHVGFMGCHGALNGLRAAHALCLSTQQPTLLVCTEVCTAHLHYGWYPDRIVANALFADGAAAVVLEPLTHHATSTFQLVDHFTTIVPDSSHDMTWHLGDHGFEMTLRSTVPDRIAQQLHDALTPWLTRHGLTPRDVACWALHPGGPRILTAALEALDLNPTHANASKDVLRHAGNMSSPTLLFILQKLQQHPTPGPCVALAFGPGLTIEAALLSRP